MGLLEKIKTSFGFTADNPVPAKAKFATREDVVYAPCSGVLVSLKEVNDEVVSAGLLGEGYGVMPVGDGILYAPCDCRVGATTVTNPTTVPARPSRPPAPTPTSTSPSRSTSLATISRLSSPPR